MKTRNFSLAVIISTSMTLGACGGSSDDDDSETQLPVIQDPVTDPVVEPVVDLPDPILNPAADPTVDLPDPIVDPVTDPVVDLPDPVVDPAPDPVVDLPDPVVDPAPGPVVDLPDPTIDLPDPTIDLPDPTIDLPDPTIDLPDPTIDLPDPTIDLPGPVIDLPDAAIQSTERTLESDTEPDLSLSEILTLEPDQAWKCEQSEEDLSLPELTSRTVFETRSEENPDRGTGTFLLDSDPISLPINIDWDFTNDVLTIADTSTQETLEQWFNTKISNTDNFTAVSFNGLDVNCITFDVEQP